MERNKIDYLVIDSGAFIKGTQLHELSDNLYTIHEVINEIKDKATKARLEALPYELQYKEPSQEDIRFVADFAKKTGDFSFLSLTDIKVIALTYALEKQFNGTEHLHSEPNEQRIITKTTNKVVKTDANIDGFYYPKNGNKSESDVKTNDFNNEKQIENENDTEFISNLNATNTSPNEEDEDDEDDAGWITPSNIKEIQQKVSSISLTEETSQKTIVGCITGDFSMQNVLIQIGLNVVSLSNGLIIKETKQFVLRCHACFKITTNLMKKFCPHCGNLGTLKRV
ncbi:RNA-binding protein NOB1-like protein, partial [Leptotrombidium deliense]